MQANSVQCRVCKKNDSQTVQWCACGDLSRLADGFRCRRCDGTIQEDDLAGNLMMDGETYRYVKKLLLSGRHS